MMPLTNLTSAGILMAISDHYPNSSQLPFFAETRRPVGVSKANVTGKIGRLIVTTTKTTDRRKYSTFSDAIKLLNDNDPNAIHPETEEAGTNIMALARLAALKPKWVFGTACPAVSGMRSVSGIMRCA